MITRAFCIFIFCLCILCILSICSELNWSPSLQQGRTVFTDEAAKNPSRWTSCRLVRSTLYSYFYWSHFWQDQKRFWACLLSSSGSLLFLKMKGQDCTKISGSLFPAQVFVNRTFHYLNSIYASIRVSHMKCRIKSLVWRAFHWDLGGGEDMTLTSIFPPNSSLNLNSVDFSHPQVTSSFLSYMQ